jgi:hypothetical protein
MFPQTELFPAVTTTNSDLLLLIQGKIDAAYIPSDNNLYKAMARYRSWCTEKNILGDAVEVEDFFVYLSKLVSSNQWKWAYNMFYPLQTTIEADRAYNSMPH